MSENRRTAEQLLRSAQGAESHVAASLAQVAIGYALLAAVDVLAEQVALMEQAYMPPAEPAQRELVDTNTIRAAFGLKPQQSDQ